MNLYDLLNEEMKRLIHDRDHWYSTVLNVDRNNATSVKLARDQYYKYSDLVDEQRKKIFAQFENYDKKIQEKVAELALTGKADE